MKRRLAHLWLMFSPTAGKSFEIVYVPASVPGRPPEDEKSYKELMSMMPWLAIPVHRKRYYSKILRHLGTSERSLFRLVPYFDCAAPGFFVSLLTTFCGVSSTHKKLTRRFQVRQIPMLVLLDQDGKTIHRDITPAVTHIVEDADGESFAGKSRLQAHKRAKIDRRFLFLTRVCMEQISSLGLTSATPTSRACLVIPS
jgi:hypothetical protein